MLRIVTRVARRPAGRRAAWGPVRRRSKWMGGNLAQGRRLKLDQVTRSSAWLGNREAG